MKKNSNDFTKNGSSFSGGLLGLIGIELLSFLVSIITLGLASPWLYVMKRNWYIKHTTYNGRKLLFVGKGGQLFRLFIKWVLLSIITIGIYSLWVPVHLMKWETENTHFADGQKIGESKFTGKTGGLIGKSIVCDLLFIITLGFALPSVIAIMTEWRTKHTVIDGHKLSFDGKGISLIGRYILWFLLTIITIGIYSLWIPLKFENWKVSHTKIVGYTPKVVAVIDVKPETKVEEIEEIKEEEKPKVEEAKPAKVVEAKVEKKAKRSRKTEFRITNFHTSILALICYFLWLVSVIVSFVLISQKIYIVSDNILVLTIVYSVLLVLSIVAEFVLLLTKSDKIYKRVQNLIVFSTLYLIFLIVYGLIEFLTPVLLEDMWFMYIIIGLLSVAILIILFGYVKLYKKATIEKSNDERIYRDLRRYVNIFFIIGIIFLLALFPLTMLAFSYIHTLGDVYQLGVIFFEMCVIYLFATLNIILFFNNVIWKDFHRRLEDEENAEQLKKIREKRIEELLLSATKKLHSKPLSEQLKKEAFGELEEAMKLGSIVAYAIVGKYYEEKRIYRKAIKYYTKGFEKKCPDSTLFLSVMYKFGAGVPKDLQKSHELLKKAAEFGNIKAMRTLYIEYLDWNNYEKAFEYLLMAYNAGDFKSTLILAQSYAVGNLVVKGEIDSVLAESYFLKANELASKKSEKSAAYNLFGQFYASQYPIDQDEEILKRSLYFLVGAAKLGNQDVVKAINKSEINPRITAWLLEEVRQLDLPDGPILKPINKE